VVWNVEKVLDQEAPHFDASQVGVTASRMPTLRSARVIDEMTVELTTSEPDAFLPINLTNLFMASPAHWQAKFDAVESPIPSCSAPSRPGPPSPPIPRARARSRSPASPRASGSSSPPTPTTGTRRARPQIDRVVMIPLPEANARTAALLSGQVDWIEAPRPTPSRRSRARGFVIHSNAQPHVWPWQLSFIEGSPWLDKRVRHAANLCINREELKAFLGGYMADPVGTVAPDHPWWGNPSFEIKYDPDAARALMRRRASRPPIRSR
jgi:peptide/nickel transport system substrate-binding protein